MVQFSATSKATVIVDDTPRYWVSGSTATNTLYTGPPTIDAVSAVLVFDVVGDIGHELVMASHTGALYYFTVFFFCSCESHLRHFWLNVFFPRT